MILISADIVTLGVAATAPVALERLERYRIEAGLLDILEALAHGHLSPADPDRADLTAPVRTLDNLHEKHLLSQLCTVEYLNTTPDFYETCELGTDGMQAMLLTDIPAPGTEFYSYDNFCTGSIKLTGIKNNLECRAVGIHITGPYEHNDLAEKVVLAHGIRRALSGHFPKFDDDRYSAVATSADWFCNYLFSSWSLY